MDKCWNCVNKENSNEFCQFCIEHNYCSYKYDTNKPRYNFEIARQLLFNVAMDLEYDENVNKAECSRKILDILNQLDKMRCI